MNITPLQDSDRQSRSAVGNVACFLRDLVTLVELQALLFVADAGDEFRKSRTGLLLIVGFGAIAASCLPLGLAGVALVLADATELTIGQSLLCVAAAGLVLAVAIVVGAARSIWPDENCLRRSRSEWHCNVDWLKGTLKHHGRNSVEPSCQQHEMRR